MSIWVTLISQPVASQKELQARAAIDLSDYPIYFLLTRADNRHRTVAMPALEDILNMPQAVFAADTQ